MSKHIKDPEDYFERFVKRVFEHRIIHDKTWIESARLARNETSKELEMDFKKEIVDGLIQIVFGE